MSNIPGSVGDVPPQALLSAVEDQRLCLLDVLGSVHCLCGAIEGDEERFPEIGAAFELVEQEIRRIVTGLEEVSLRNAVLRSAGQAARQVSPSML